MSGVGVPTVARCRATYCIPYQAVGLINPVLTLQCLWADGHSNVMKHRAFYKGEVLEW